MDLQIAGIERESVVDGPGLRFVLFTQGCPHACQGCHNPQTHDPAGGINITVEKVLAMIKEARLIRGVTFSGGEPFMQPEAVSLLAAEVHKLALNVMTYTGFIYEDLLERGRREPAVMRLLSHTDILVDGPFIEDERDIQLLFRGSANQRLIDVPASLAAGRTVLWQNPEEKFWA